MAAYNIGEEITGLYLQFAKECAFVQYNVYTPDVQGEIDVVAINFNKRIVYVCEVAVHLITGLQYVKNARPDTAARLIKKFRKDVDYAEKAFSAYERVHALVSDRETVWAKLQIRPDESSSRSARRAAKRTQCRN